GAAQLGQACDRRPDHLLGQLDRGRGRLQIRRRHARDSTGGEPSRPRPCVAVTLLSMASVCVFCGANPGDDRVLTAVAHELGLVLASAGHTLVYGGGRVGLMGTVADAALAAGGRVVGFIPQSLKDREVAHTGLTELVVTD